MRYFLQIMLKINFRSFLNSSNMIDNIMPRLALGDINNNSAVINSASAITVPETIKTVVK